MPRAALPPDDERVARELGRLLRDIDADYEVLDHRWSLTGDREVPTALRVAVKVAMGPELEVWVAQVDDGFDWTVKGAGRGMFTAADPDPAARARAYGSGG